MSSVVSLKGDTLGDERKRQFLDIVARTYDMMAEDGDVPDSIVFTISELRGCSRVNWLCLGEAEGCASGVLGRAMADLNVRYVRHQMG